MIGHDLTLNILKVAREERRLRMLQREMEKEDTKSSRKRKEAKHNYAAKVLKYRTQIQNINIEHKY